jgi:hypothetical protein
VSPKAKSSARDAGRVAFRFSPAVIKRIERYQGQMRESMPGVEFTLTDAVRALIELGLQHVEGRGRRG